ncbi:MAG: glycosyltransferase family 1 protein [Patescibacteria group bacterium]|nr:glycosyltransferase family 1 protein [Patescibacteria group bacterium]
MKIAIDIRNIGKGRTGDEVVFFELVKNLALIDDNNDYKLLIDDRSDDEITEVENNLGITNKNNFTVVQLGSGNKFVWNGWKIAKYCVDEKIDIYHTQYIIPFFIPVTTKIVTHIHDVSFKAHKELISKKDAFFLNRLIPRAVKKSDKVIAVSQFTKDEIVKYYNVPADKISVIYNASSLVEVNTDEKSVREKYQLPMKYVLALGTMQPRKNIPFLVEAFAGIANEVSDTYLVLAGKKSHNFDQSIEKIIKQYPQLKDKIIFTDYIDEDDKFLVYKMADVFAFPSLYEGFGVPILEAFTAGTAVIASDIAPHKEVAGDSALYFSPIDIDQCKKMLYDALVNDRIRNDVLAVATQQKKQFSWYKSAQKLRQLYENMYCK